VDCGFGVGSLGIGVGFGVDGGRGTESYSERRRERVGGMVVRRWVGN